MSFDKCYTTATHNTNAHTKVRKGPTSYYLRVMNSCDPSTPCPSTVRLRWNRFPHSIFLSFDILEDLKNKKWRQIMWLLVHNWYDAGGCRYTPFKTRRRACNSPIVCISHDILSPPAAATQSKWCGKREMPRFDFKRRGRKKRKKNVCVYEAGARECRVRSFIGSSVRGRPSGKNK